MGRWVAQNEPLIARGLPSYDAQQLDPLPAAHRATTSSASVVPDGGRRAGPDQLEHAPGRRLPIWFYLEDDPLGPFVDAHQPLPTPIVLDEDGSFGAAASAPRPGGGTLADDGHHYARLWPPRIHTALTARVGLSRRGALVPQRRDIANAGHGHRFPVDGTCNTQAPIGRPGLLAYFRLRGAARGPGQLPARLRWWDAAIFRPPEQLRRDFRRRGGRADDLRHGQHRLLDRPAPALDCLPGRPSRGPGGVGRTRAVTA